MKNTVLLLIIWLGCSATLTVSAQRALPGMQSIRATAGMVDGFQTDRNKLAYYFGLSMDRYVKGGG